jgi:Mitochondrial small ribosomal subunit Rsm22
MMKVSNVGGCAPFGFASVGIKSRGTPGGHRRILAARDILIGAGLTIVAPCPQQHQCPLAEGADWCHFTARVDRSSLHRRLKGGSLAYEDEKFSYIAASRSNREQSPGRVRRTAQPGASNGANHGRLRHRLTAEQQRGQIIDRA